MTPIPNKFMEAKLVDILDEFLCGCLEYNKVSKKDFCIVSQGYFIEKIEEAYAKAITAAEERGRKAGLEEAAKVADNFICLHRHEPMCRVDSHRDLIAQAIRSLSKSEVGK